MKLHALLLRQLKRVGIDPDAEDTRTAVWRALLERVSRAYEEHEQEAYLLERSQDLASQEMAELYATVRADRDLLESRVQERTEALRISESRLASLLSLSADWIWEQDAELRFTYISDAIEAAAGFSPELLIGQQQIDSVSADTPSEAIATFEAALDLRKPFRDFTYGFDRPDGSRCYIRVSGEPVFNDTGEFQGYRGVGRDVTQDRLAEQKVHELARFDGLTGLPNRNMFLGELDRAIARGRRKGEHFAVCFIDLDRFKTVNDTLGHSAGDELLRSMATRLRSALREADLVARLGGDEFVVLLEGNSDVHSLTTIAEKLLTAIGEPMLLHSHRFLVTGSIGIGLFPNDGEDSATLLKHADAAMYLAKEKGKNNVQFYTAELAKQAAQQFELESALQLALLNDEFLLHYQPKVDIASGAMIGVEALLRWQHPTRGMVPPMDFIPLAEECGLILPVGRWVIEAACRQIHAWRRAGLEPPSIAVNLSARQFASSTLVDDITAALAAHEVVPAQLEVELTESVLMADPEWANQVLQQLHRLGIRISIDDFGTGYSSLSYLKRFPAQTVKIDRSFIHGLPVDKDDIAITEAVIAMAHSLRLKVVAEGVETAEQLDTLRRLHCDEAQGYLLGRPMPAAELAKRLQPSP
ncbi:MAG TPA: EAL domain-containing protein [Burkholderiaceae bacterium]|jgi:diguanylate cyclase (GGDEF)-like protein/PAS domain S-box-containing protein